MTVCRSLTSVPVAVIETPGNALPDTSATVPRMVPVCWAVAAAALSANSSAARPEMAAVRRSLRDVSNVVAMTRPPQPDYERGGAEGAGHHLAGARMIYETKIRLMLSWPTKFATSLGGARQTEPGDDREGNGSRARSLAYKRDAKTQIATRGRWRVKSRSFRADGERMPCAKRRICAVQYPVLPFVGPHNGSREDG